MRGPGYKTVLVVAGLSILAGAQQFSFRLVKVTATGSQQYTSDQIAAASGLQLGKTVGQADLQEGANRLGTAGVFSAVRYEYLPSGVGGRDVTVAFQVTDNPAVRPLIYDNLVWFTREDLDREIASRVPLYRGVLPDAGSLQDDVSAVVQQLLATRGISTKVTIQAQQENIGSKIDAFVVRADLPVRVTSVSFPGASAQNLDALQKEAQRLVSTPYSANFTKGFCAGDLKQVYEELGFLQAEFGEPQIALLPGQQTPVITLTVPVQEGQKFQFAGAKFSGNTAVSASDLAHLVPLKPGDTANAIALQRALDGLPRLYGPHGYMAVTHKVEAHLTGQQAAFEIAINEGPQYHMGELKLEGLAPAAEQKLQSQWQLAKGAVYDDTYKLQYAIKAVSQLRSRTQGIRYIFSERLNDQAATVDLDIAFRPE